MVQTVRHARSAAKQVLHVNTRDISRSSRRYLKTVIKIDRKMSIAIKLRAQLIIPRIVATVNMSASELLLIKSNDKLERIYAKSLSAFEANIYHFC